MMVMSVSGRLFCRQFRWYRESSRPVGREGFFYSKIPAGIRTIILTKEKPKNTKEKFQKNTKEKGKKFTKENLIICKRKTKRKAKKRKMQRKTKENHSKNHHSFKEELKCTTKYPIT